MRHVHEVIAAIAPHDSVERFEGLGVRVIKAEARFAGPRQVMAGDCLIEARRIVIATGSAPALPPIPGLADVPFLTNESIFDMARLPAHLLVLGGGPIGQAACAVLRHAGAGCVILSEPSRARRERSAGAMVVLVARCATQKPADS